MNIPFYTINSNFHYPNKFPILSAGNYYDVIIESVSQ